MQGPLYKARQSLKHSNYGLCKVIFSFAVKKPELKSTSDNNDRLLYFELWQASENRGKNDKWKAFRFGKRSVKVKAVANLEYASQKLMQSTELMLREVLNF